MTILDRPDFLRRVLLLDAGICVATGLLMTSGSGALGRLTHIPPELLFYAGLSLFPIAAFMAIVAFQRPQATALVWLVIAGNVGWVIGSLGLLGGGIQPNAMGIAFILLQAAAVAWLAALEYLGLTRQLARV